jgi:hypothetical protein
MIDGLDVMPRVVNYDRPCVFFIATQHEVYATLDYPVGSVVIDPFGYVTNDDHVTLVTPGRKYLV